MTKPPATDVKHHKEEIYKSGCSNSTQKVSSTAYRTWENRKHTNKGGRADKE
jgi:hypothetical protein